MTLIVHYADWGTANIPYVKGSPLYHVLVEVETRPPGGLSTSSGFSTWTIGIFTKKRKVVNWITFTNETKDYCHLSTSVMGVPFTNQSQTGLQKDEEDTNCSTGCILFQTYWQKILYKICHHIFFCFYTTSLHHWTYNFITKIFGQGTNQMFPRFWGRIKISVGLKGIERPLFVYVIRKEDKRM